MEAAFSVLVNQPIVKCDVKYFLEMRCGGFGGERKAIDEKREGEKV